MPESRLPSFDSLRVGEAIPSLVLPAVTRHQLALYCGASGDHNPLHTDSDHAREKAGLPDVIAHGMLSMAWLGRAVTNWAPQRQLRSYSVRFASMTLIHDVVTCGGSITEKFVVDGERRVRLALEARTHRGNVTLTGEAVVAIP
jgi:acyl dehydratase